MGMRNCLGVTAVTCCWPGEDLQSMGYVKLKKHLLSHGFSKQELDACNGRQALLYLWSTKQQVESDKENSSANVMLAAEAEAGAGAVAESAHDSMQIVVKTLDGKSLPIQVKGTDTCHTIMLAIQDINDVPPAHQRLIFGGKQLENDCILEYYGITDQSVLYSVLRLMPMAAPELPPFPVEHQKPFHEGSSAVTLIIDCEIYTDLLLETEDPVILLVTRALAPLAHQPSHSGYEHQLLKNQLFGSCSDAGNAAAVDWQAAATAEEVAALVDACIGAGDQDRLEALALDNLQSLALPTRLGLNAMLSCCTDDQLELIEQAFCTKLTNVSVQKSMSMLGVCDALCRQSRATCPSRDAELLLRLYGELPHAVVQMVLSHCQTPFWLCVLRHAFREDKLTEITLTPEDTNTSIIDKVAAQEGGCMFTCGLFAAQPSPARFSQIQIQQSEQSGMHSSKYELSFFGCRVHQLNSDILVVKDMKLPLEIWATSSPKSSVRVLFRDLKGQFCHLFVDPRQTVDALKEQYEAITGLPACKQRLIFNAMQLDGGMKLIDYGFGAATGFEALIHVVLRLGGD